MLILGWAGSDVLHTKIRSALVVAMILVMHHVVGRDEASAYEEVAWAAPAGRGARRH
jgi:hypothetical protein